MERWNKAPTPYNACSVAWLLRQNAKTEEPNRLHLKARSMAISSLSKAPFFWFGGKSDAAPATWEALGDVDHYIEPFAGSLAVLLKRPHPCNRKGKLETVNDLDALVVNFWRSMKYSPRETAEAASWPVTECDKHARWTYLIKWRKTKSAAHLAGDPKWHDPEMAGWWAWCICVSIGLGSNEGGRWRPDSNGILRRQKKSSELGVQGSRPSVLQGAPIPSKREVGIGNYPYHDIVMPDIDRWFKYLSARLRHVSILNGDWSRACRKGVVNPGKLGGGTVGVFLDPPYGDVGRSSLYGKHEDMTVAGEVRRWCLERGSDEKVRIVYAGFDEEGLELEEAGWRVVEWFKPGILKGGMANTSTKEDAGQQHRERLWLSPHCLKPQKKKRKGFFDET